MAIRAPLRVLTLSALLASAVVTVAWTRPVQEKGPPPASAKEGGDLEDVMHGIDKNFEAVIAAIEKKDGPAALELMTKLEQGVLSARLLTPPKLRTVEEKDKPAFVAGYRKQMMTLLKAMADLEIALIDGKLDDAQKLTDEIDNIKKSGHDAYKKMPRKKQG